MGPPVTSPAKGDSPEEMAAALGGLTKLKSAGLYGLELEAGVDAAPVAAPLRSATVLRRRGLLLPDPRTAIPDDDHVLPGVAAPAVLKLLFVTTPVWWCCWC